MKYYTSIEQSKKLLELGLNPESADMHYILMGDIDSGNIIDSDICPLEVGKPYGKLTLPCWSLSALLDLVSNYTLRHMNGKYWAVFYSAPIITVTPTYISEKCENAFEAVYLMVCWLLENNYIKK